MTVFCGMVTDIRRRNCAMVRSPSSFRATGSSTSAEVARRANESICAWVYADPWLMSEPLVAVVSEKYSDAVEW
jgi:hypothetical protein